MATTARPRELNRSVATFNVVQIVDTPNQMLTRYWFMVPGLEGFGVTAFSIDDARFLLEGEGVLIDDDSEVIVNIDVSTLESRYVLEHSGPSCFRGVWFPCLNIGWVDPGAHHPANGGRIKPAPPVACQISVGPNTDAPTS